jgi:hypothetical protein
VANFQVRGPEEGNAELAVIPLPGMGGTDLDLINLWRSTLSLPPIDESEIPSHTENITIAGQPVKLFNIVGESASDADVAASQILVAALRRDGFTWFFKLAGDAKVVAANRDPLKQFLDDVEFVAPDLSGLASAPAPRSPAQGSGSAGGTPQWQAPADWQSVPASQMVHSKWSVPGGGEGSATITVSVFPGDTGGLVANLNRWRSQVSLQPAPEAELTANLNNLDVLGGKATLVDFTGSNPESGDPERLLAAIVARGGMSWFYKLIGPPAVVEAQREAFVKFVQSVQYPPRS